MPRVTSVSTSVVAVLAGLCMVGACRSSDGDPVPAGGAGQAAPPGAPPVDDPVLGLGTPVGLNAMGYALPGLTSCLRKTPGAALPTVPTGLVLDGSLDEWTEVPAQPDDPAGDAPASVDVSRVVFARDGDDLVLAAVTSPADGATFAIELGGLLARQGKLVVEVRRRFRLLNGAFEESANDGATWSIVPESLGQFRRGAEGIEMRMSARLLGDVVNWPVWWGRVHVTPPAALAQGGTVYDSTPAAYFISMLGADDLPFSLDTCTHWSGKRIPFSFTHVQDSRDNLVANKLPSSFGEEGFQLARYGFDAAMKILGDVSLPVTRLPVIVTANAVPSDLLIQDPYDPATPFGWPYRGLVLAMDELKPGTTVDFPQGPLVERAAQSIFELYLRGVRPDAPVHLVRAVATALRRHVAMRELGRSYATDRADAAFGGVGPFLAASDLEAPITLAQRGARLEDLNGFESPEGRAKMLVQTLAKIEGLGRILAAYYEPSALLAAWSAAGSDAAFLNALEGATAKLGGGWLLAGPYEKPHGPGALADQDADGLLNVEELILGTDPAKSDTDGDAWSDAAELAAGLDPTSAASVPDRLMPDGLFDDWIELMPKRVNLDKGRSTRCPIAADVTHYAAVANRDELMIGAIAADFWEQEPRARWEATLDFPGIDRQFLITAAGDSNTFQLKDPRNDRLMRTFQRGMPMARRTIEWAFSRKQLGLQGVFAVKDTVNIRLRTVFRDGDQDVLCDETSWFSPVISD